MKVLLLNHKHVQCGVYQFGKRVYSLASRSRNVDYFYRDVKNSEEYYSAINKIQPDFIIYNWHWDRMGWLTGNDITERKHIKHMFIYHDTPIFPIYDKYLFFGKYIGDDVFKKAGQASPIKRVVLPRPLYDYDGEYPVNSVPTIGSFGFAFNHKRFPELVRLVNKCYSNAVINLHMTNPYFGDTKGNSLGSIVRQCRKSNVNRGVKLNIETDFMDDDSLLTFLAKNDINIFYYNSIPIPGFSSSPDYALSVHRPIGITNNPMFSHISSNDILLEKHSIQELINNGTAPLEYFYKQWSTENFVKELDALIIDEYNSNS